MCNFTSCIHKGTYSKLILISTHFTQTHGSISRREQDLILGMYSTSSPDYHTPLLTGTRLYFVPGAQAILSVLFTNRVYYCEFHHKTLFVFGNKDLEYCSSVIENFALKTARDIVTGMALGCNFYIWRNPASSFELVFNDGTLENQLKIQGTTTV